MASSRIPGPLGTAGPHTPARTPGPLGVSDQGDPTVTTLLGDTPGPLGTNDLADPTLPVAVPEGASPGTAVRASDGSAVSAGQATPTAQTETDPEIEALDLGATARTAAYELKKAHPSVKFTSGRRGKEDQARAMSQNVAKNRKWIAETYKKSTVRDKCQEWVDANTDKKTAKEIEAGLLSVFNSVTDEELSKISKHLSGDAFDVQPVDKDADAIKKTLRGLSGLDKFLDTEGGLVRWHAQF
jgi:hypothetical protein